ncbi:MAG: CopD family protein [Rubrivivax sp.]
MLYATLLWLHLAGVIVWVGGMFFAHQCLRPAALQVLEPPQRLALWAATLQRFLRWAAASVLVVLGSGVAMLARAGFAAAPPGWHVMAAGGLVMAVLFVLVYGVRFPRLRDDVAAARWPAAAAHLNTIRRLVGANLVLAVLVIAAAVSAR